MGLTGGASVRDDLLSGTGPDRAEPSRSAAPKLAFHRFHLYLSTDFTEYYSYRGNYTLTNGINSLPPVCMPYILTLNKYAQSTVLEGIMVYISLSEETRKEYLRLVLL